MWNEYNILFSQSRLYWVTRLSDTASDELLLYFFCRMIILMAFNKIWYFISKRDLKRSQMPKSLSADFLSLVRFAISKRGLKGTNILKFRIFGRNTIYNVILYFIQFCCCFFSLNWLYWSKGTNKIWIFKFELAYFSSNFYAFFFLQNDHLYTGMWVVDEALKSCSFILLLESKNNERIPVMWLCQYVMLINLWNKTDNSFFFVFFLAQIYVIGSQKQQVLK